VKIRSVLGVPGVSRMYGASLLARLPIPVLGLLLVLRLRELGESYSVAGTIAATFSVAMAVGAPLIGRSIDRRGQTEVLSLTAAATAVLLGAAALVTPVWALAPLVALAGLLQPPVGACTRVLWPVLMPDPPRVQAAFALDAAAFELTYVLSPLIVVGALGAWSAQAGLIACALLLAGGTAAFLTTPASRGWRPDPTAGRVRGGALGSQAVRVLVVANLLTGVAFGAVELSVTAFADHDGHRGSTGLLLAAWALASVAGALVLARRPPATDRPRLLAMLCLAMAGGTALCALAPSTAWLAIMLIASGAGIAATGAILFPLAGDVAPAGAVTEAFLWLTSGIAAGFAIGSGGAGALVDVLSPRAGLLLAGLALAAAGATVWSRRAVLADQRPRSTTVGSSPE
jgi:MFS family permease